MQQTFNDKFSMRILFIFMILGTGYLFLFSFSKDELTIDSVFNQNSDEKLINKLLTEHKGMNNIEFNKLVSQIIYDLSKQLKYK